ncbi:hypothetical protein P9D43_06950, partial [Neobacillus niacini]
NPRSFGASRSTPLDRIRNPRSFGASRSTPLDRNTNPRSFREVGEKDFPKTKDTHQVDKCLKGIILVLKMQLQLL